MSRVVCRPGDQGGEFEPVVLFDLCAVFAAIDVGEIPFGAATEWDKSESNCDADGRKDDGDS